MDLVIPCNMVLCKGSVCACVKYNAKILFNKIKRFFLSDCRWCWYNFSDHFGWITIFLVFDFSVSISLHNFVLIKPLTNSIWLNQFWDDDWTRKKIYRFKVVLRLLSRVKSNRKLALAAITVVLWLWSSLIYKINYHDVLTVHQIRSWIPCQTTHTCLCCCCLFEGKKPVILK